MTSSDALVASLHAAAFTLPTDRPEADGTLSWSSTTVVVVEARTEKLTGIGWTYAPAACAGLIRDVLAPIVVERPVLDVDSTWEAMVRSIRNAGRPGVAGYALSAVDTALWDLKARLLDLPLHRLLGAVRPSVPLYGSGGFTTYDDRTAAEQLSGWLSEGFTQVKMKIGESGGARAERDLQRVAMARKVVGDDVGLFVDANGAFTSKQAIRLGPALVGEGVSWFEEPVSSEDLAGLRQVRSRLQCDVTAGEYGCQLSYFRRMCQGGCVDCLQVDISRCGGITEWMRVAAVAASYELEISGHCAPHLHVHAAAATPNLRHLEWFHDHVRIENKIFDGTLDPRGGELELAEGVAGNGLALRAADAEPYRVA